MLTIFSIPKPFKGHIGIIQNNALRSWLKLPGCEVLLFGDDEGVAGAAAELGAVHVADVAKNEFNTPLLDRVFEEAQRKAANSILCHVNADIILFDDLISAVRQIRFEKFLMVGRRWDVSIERPWDFEAKDWQERLKSFVAAHGAMHPPAGSDYFVFPRGALGKMPPFAVGRPGWDNWLIYDARIRKIAVVDATETVTVVHQNHDHSHVAKRTGDAWQCPEAKKHMYLIGGWDRVFTLDDSNWMLTPGGLRRPKWSRRRMLRFLETLPAFHPWLRPAVSLGRPLWRSVYRLFGNVKKVAG